MSNKNQNLTVARQVADIASAAMPVAVDPDDADMMGAFHEDALSADDAMESRFDDVAEGSEA